MVRKPKNSPKKSLTDAYRFFMEMKMEANSKFLGCERYAVPLTGIWIIGDSEFAKANQTLYAICKNMMKEGKVGPVVHKHPITS